MRRFGPHAGGMSAPFAALNRGKRTVVLDLKDAAARAEVLALARDADVVVEQFRPGVMARLGLGWDELRRVNPRLVYCSISGYGQDGPKAGEAGHDVNYVGETGLLALSPGDIGRPTLPPALIADIGGGSLPAVANILLALIQRERTGQGSRLDIAMADAMFTFGVFAHAAAAATGRAPAAGELVVTGASPRYRLYPAADGRIVACGALEEKFWQSFCAAIGLGEEFRPATADTVATAAAVAAIIRSKPAAHWAPLLAAADCCCTVMRTLDEAMADPHFRARGLFDHSTRLPDGSDIVALPVPVAQAFRRNPGEARPAPPLPR